MAGAGGILLDPEGQTEQTFAWGLGHRTNNEAEWMAFLQGMEILANTDLSRIAIFRDSRHVIYKMINGYTSISIKCRWLYDKIIPLLSKNYEFYHNLHANNAAADALANVGASFPQGHYCLNGLGINTKPIP